MQAGLVVQMIVSVVGGLGIFLLGMKNMSEGMQAVAGTRMRKLINAVTNNRLIACGVGITITSLIQSSSVTTVMVVGMVNAELMNLTQAIGVILGADIGTTITGWILVLQLSKYGLAMLGISAFFFLFSKNESGLKSPNTTVSTRTTGVIGLILKVLGDCFAANYLFRADSRMKGFAIPR